MDRARSERALAIARQVAVHRHAVLLAGSGLILGQILFRGWALYRSWFYLDDYSLLLEARARGLNLDYLLTPWNGHLMPGGRLVAWIVASSGDLNWPLAASLTLFIQLLASVAALWMLATLFGLRWGVLPPLALYLSSAVTMPALMWWTACLNQLATQLGFFLAVAAWVHYLRGRRLRWAIVAYGGVAVGLLFDVKAVLILPVLVYIALGYFCEGSFAHRVQNVLKRYWAAAAVVILPLLAYLWYYTTHVEDQFASAGPGLAARLADTMLGTAFASGLIGGPWRWSPLAPPNSFADPPNWAVHLAWIVITLVVLYGFLRRTRTLRAWALLIAYLGVLLALLLTSRAPVYGELIGLEYRYITEASCVVTLVLGLVFMPLHQAVQSSEPREPPYLLLGVPGWATTLLVALICTSGIVSSAMEVRYWHDDNASISYMHTLRSDLRAFGAVDLVDQPVPDEIYPAIFAPDNSVRRLVSLVTDKATFPDASANLLVVGPDGGLRKAAIQPGVASVEGPAEDCGWPVGPKGRTIPLTGKAFDWVWWVRIGYLSSSDSPVEITAGDTTIDTTVQSGANSLYLRVEGTFDTIRIDGLDPGTTLCVDTVEVGQVVPGGRAS
jgi:hypothetical protein